MIAGRRTIRSGPLDPLWRINAKKGVTYYRASYGRRRHQRQRIILPSFQVIYIQLCDTGRVRWCPIEGLGSMRSIDGSGDLLSNGEIMMRGRQGG